MTQSLLIDSGSDQEDLKPTPSSERPLQSDGLRACYPFLCVQAYC